MAASVETAGPAAPSLNCTLRRLCSQFAIARLSVAPVRHLHLVTRYVVSPALCREPIKDGGLDVKKTVDVSVQDLLVASYPVVAKAVDRPTDDDFVERIKQQMRSY
jgi:hypothetical protein